MYFSKKPVVLNILCISVWAHQHKQNKFIWITLWCKTSVLPKLSLAVGLFSRQAITDIDTFFSVDNEVLIKVICPGTVSIAIYSERMWWFLRFGQSSNKPGSTESNATSLIFSFFFYCFIVSSPFSSCSIRFMSHQHT